MNTRYFFMPALLVALASLSACGGSADPKPVNLSKYDRSCTADADCITVPSFNCAACDTNNASINKKDEAAFSSDWNAVEAQCPYHEAAPCVAVQAKATCKNAVCTSVPVR